MKTRSNNLLTVKAYARRYVMQAVSEYSLPEDVATTLHDKITKALCVFSVLEVIFDCGFKAALTNEKGNVVVSTSFGDVGP